MFILCSLAAALSTGQQWNASVGAALPMPQQSESLWSTCRKVLFSRWPNHFAKIEFELVNIIARNASD
jgi:hypothetical protein